MADGHETTAAQHESAPPDGDGGLGAPAVARITSPRDSTILIGAATNIMLPPLLRRNLGAMGGMREVPLKVRDRFGGFFVRHLSR
jgi:hypothetical protein